MHWALLSLVVVIGVFAAWFFWPQRSRRAAELRQPSRQFHWGLVSAYMGRADPTLLAADEAARILIDGWSCPDVRALHEKLNVYRAGEINDAFDAARIVWLAELALAAKWLSTGELQQLSDEAATRVKAAHDSWKDLQAAVEEGRVRWWKEVARSAVPAEDQQRLIAVRSETATTTASIPW